MREEEGRPVLAYALAALAGIAVGIGALALARPWYRADEAAWLELATLLGLAAGMGGAHGTARLLGSHRRLAALVGWASGASLVASPILARVLHRSDPAVLAAALFPLAPCLALAWRGDPLACALRAARGWLSFMVALAVAAAWWPLPGRLVEAAALDPLRWAFLGLGFARALHEAATPAPERPAGAAERARRALAPRWARVVLAAGAGLLVAKGAAAWLGRSWPPYLLHYRARLRIAPDDDDFQRALQTLAVAALLAVPVAAILELDRPRPRRRAVLVVWAGVVAPVAAALLCALAAATQGWAHPEWRAVVLGALVAAVASALAARVRLALREAGRAAGLRPIARAAEGAAAAGVLASLAVEVDRASRMAGGDLEATIAVVPVMLVLACEIGAREAVAAARPRKEGAA